MTKIAVKKLKVRVTKAEKVTDDMATVSVSKGFGVAQKDFEVNVYADDTGIRIEVNNDNGDNMAESDWPWEELIEEKERQDRMKVTMDIPADQVTAIKSFLADQAQRRQAASKIASDPKEVSRFQAESEFCKDTFNAICDAQNWASHEARAKVVAKVG